MTSRSLKIPQLYLNPLKHLFKLNHGLFDRLYTPADLYFPMTRYTQRVILVLRNHNRPLFPYLSDPSTNKPIRTDNRSENLHFSAV